jgi:signal peptidase I
METIRKETTELIKDMQDELFEIEGKGWFRIISGSMYPLIEINDKALVKKISLSEIKLGDVVLFRQDGVFVTHRVLRLSKQNGRPMILQKGDASNHASWVPIDDVVGKVFTIEKRGKSINLDSKQGRMINGFFGLKNNISYHLALHISPIKQYLRDKPGFIFLRVFYRILTKSVHFINNMMLRFLTKTT